MEHTMDQSATKFDLRRTLVYGSDELFDLICQPCSTEGQHLEAVAYCDECKEYLCNICYNCHMKMVATKAHKLLDKSEMPGVIRSHRSGTKNGDYTKENCSRHADKALTFYCCEHTEMCCQKCLKIKHKTCENIKNASEIPKNVAVGKEYYQVKDNLQNRISRLAIRQKIIKADIDNNEQNTQTALANIAEFRRDVNKLLDELEIEAVRKVSELKEENAKLIHKEEVTCQTLLFGITKTLSRIEELANQGENNQLYAAVQRELQRARKLETPTYTHDTNISRIVFNQDEKMKAIMLSLPSIWMLSVRKEGVENKARHIRNINVQAADESLPCSITGLATVGGSSLAVADYKNKALKLIDIKQDLVFSKRTLSSEPFDITSVGNKQVAVALGNERKITLFNAFGELSKQEDISVPDSVVVSLSYDGNHFIAACQHPGSVKIIDKTGRILSTYQTSCSGEKLFIMPRNIAVNKLYDLIYVSDHDAHAVTCLTMGGTVVSVYKHEQLKRPRGLSVGEDGSVYVCACDTTTVHQLSSTGVLQRIILGVEQGLSSYPPAIAYGNEQVRLYVSSNSKCPDLANFVKVFQLE